MPVTVPRAAPPTLKATLMLIGINAVWGGSSLAAKVALYHLPFVTLAFLRFGLSAVLLYLFCLLRQKDLRVARGDWRRFWAAGALGLTMTYLLAYSGLSRTTASDAALIHAAEPVFLALLSVALLRERLGRLGALGVGMGLCGVLLVATHGGHIQRLTGTVSGDALITLGIFFEALSVILSKKLVARYPPLTVLTYQMLTGAILLAPFVLLQGERMGWHLSENALSWPTFWSMVYLIVPCTLLAYTIWFFLLDICHAVDLSVFLFIQPLFGMALGVIFQHNPLTWFLVWGGVLVVCALGLIQRGDSIPQLPPA